MHVVVVGVFTSRASEAAQNKHCTQRKGSCELRHFRFGVYCTLGNAIRADAAAKRAYVPNGGGKKLTLPSREPSALDMAVGSEGERVG